MLFLRYQIGGFEALTPSRFANSASDLLPNFRLLRDENFIPNYEAAAYDAIQAGFIEKRYFWMVALASLCVRDNEAELEEELRDKICRIFHKINRDPIQRT